MKISNLIPPLFLALFLISCSRPDADFWNEKSIIVEKRQNQLDKSKNQARFTIRCWRGNEWMRDLIFVLPENFGEVGYNIHVTTNGILSALPQLEN